MFKKIFTAVMAAAMVFVSSAIPAETLQKNLKISGTINGSATAGLGGTVNFGLQQFSGDWLVERISGSGAALTGISAASLVHTVWVSPSGNDSNTGLTTGSPLLSLTAALAKLAGQGTIIMKAGDYEVAANVMLNLATAKRLKIIADQDAVVNVFLGEKVLGSSFVAAGSHYNATVASGYDTTNATYATTPWTSDRSQTLSADWMAWVFEKDTTEGEIQKPLPLEGTRTTRNLHKRLWVTSSTASVDTSKGLYFYISGTTLSLKSTTDGNPSAKTYYIPSQAVNRSFVYGGTNETDIEIDGIRVFFGTHGFNFIGCGRWVLRNSMSYGNSVEGITANNFRSGLEENNEYACNANDGSGPDNNGAVWARLDVRNVWSHDNGDEGHSPHQKTMVHYFNCLFENNCSSGLTSALGAQINVVSVYTRENGYDFYGRFPITSNTGANPTTITLATAPAAHMIAAFPQKGRIGGNTGSVPGINGRTLTVTRVTDTTYTVPVNLGTGGTGGYLSMGSGNGGMGAAIAPPTTIYVTGWTSEDDTVSMYNTSTGNSYTIDTQANSGATEVLSPNSLPPTGAYVSTVKTTAPHGMVAGEQVFISGTTISLTQLSETAGGAGVSVKTATTSAPHAFTTGQLINVSTTAGNTSYEVSGAVLTVVGGVGSTSFTYTGLAASTGLLNPPTGGLAGTAISTWNNGTSYNGLYTVLSVPTSTTFTYYSANQSTSTRDLAPTMGGGSIRRVSKAVLTDCLSINPNRWSWGGAAGNLIQGHRNRTINSPSLTIAAGHYQGDEGASAPMSVDVPATANLSTGSGILINHPATGFNDNILKISVGGGAPTDLSFGYGSSAQSRIVSTRGIDLISGGNIVFYASTGYKADILTTGNFRLRAPTPPSLPNSTVSIGGEMSWDANYLYMSTANNVWKRVPLGWPKYQELNFTRPVIDGTTAVTLDTTTTSVNYGHATFSGSTAKATNYVLYRIRVPYDLDTTASAPMQASLSVRLNAADTAQQMYELSMSNVATSASVDLPTFSNVVTMNFTDAAGASGDMVTIPFTTLTNWNTNLTAGNILVIKLARDASVDASTQTSSDVELTIKYGKTQ